MKNKANETARLLDSVNAHPERIWVAWRRSEDEPYRVVGNTPREAYEGADEGRVVIAEYRLVCFNEARRDFVMVPIGSNNTKR